MTYKKKQNGYGFYSANPLPTPQEVKDHYTDKYYEDPWNGTYQKQYSSDEISQKILRADLTVHAIKCALGELSGKSFYEVGYGEGFILRAAKNAGMVIDGVDFTDSGLKALNSDLSGDVYVGDAYTRIDSLIADHKTYDACVIQNVLEHVIDPDDMLDKINNLLNPDGVVLINVPNDYSALQMKALELGFIDREFWFGPIEHLHYFNTDNLPKFIETKEFDVVDMYGDFPIDFFLMNPNSNYIADKTKGKGAHNARIILDLLMAEKGMDAYHKFCQAMSGVGIGRNVCVIARKKG